MENRVEVHKVELLEGEELQSFIKALHDALPMQFYLKGVWNSYVIACDRETGKMFKYQFTRTQDGGVELGDGIEVRHVFAEVQKSEDEEGAIFIDLKKSEPFWKGVL